MRIDPVKNTKSATVFLHQNSAFIHEPTLEVTSKKSEKLPVVSLASGSSISTPAVLRFGGNREEYINRVRDGTETGLQRC